MYEFVSVTNSYTIAKTGWVNLYLIWVHLGLRTGEGQMADSAPATSALRQTAVGQHPIGMRRVLARPGLEPVSTPLPLLPISFITLLLLAYPLSFPVSAYAVQEMQRYIVCKNLESQLCVTWLFHLENEKDLSNELYSWSKSNQFCGLSDLKLISPHRKFILVKPFNRKLNSRSRPIFCNRLKILTKDIFHLADDSSMLRSVYRERRQTGYNPRGRYRGQTQSQYLAIDGGNEKNEGKAEAHSAADSSSASVSGNSGMGQAQSQTIYDPSCDECYGRTDSDVANLSRRPGETGGNGVTSQGLTPGRNIVSSNQGVPDNNFIPKQYGNQGNLPDNSHGIQTQPRYNMNGHNQGSNQGGAPVNAYTPNQVIPGPGGTYQTNYHHAGPEGVQGGIPGGDFHGGIRGVLPSDGSQIGQPGGNLQGGPGTISQGQLPVGERERNGAGVQGQIPQSQPGSISQEGLPIGTPQAITPGGSDTRGQPGVTSHGAAPGTILQGGQPGINARVGPDFMPGVNLPNTFQNGEHTQFPQTSGGYVPGRSSIPSGNGKVPINSNWPLTSGPIQGSDGSIYYCCVVNPNYSSGGYNIQPNGQIDQQRSYDSRLKPYNTGNNGVGSYGTEIYGTGKQNVNGPYGTGSTGQQLPYGGTREQTPFDTGTTRQQVPYGTSLTRQQTPYGTDSTGQQSPYGTGTPGHQPTYGTGTIESQTPYGHGHTSQQTPYATGTTGQQIPYGTGGTGQHTPYGTGMTGQSTPYGTGNIGQQTPYRTGTTGQHVPYGTGSSGQQIPYGGGDTRQEIPHGTDTMVQQTPYGVSTTGQQTPYGTATGSQIPYATRPLTGRQIPYGTGATRQQTPYGNGGTGEQTPYGVSTTGQQTPYGTGTTGQQTPYGGVTSTTGQQTPYGGVTGTTGQQTPFGGVTGTTGQQTPYGTGTMGQQIPFPRTTAELPYGNGNVRQQVPYGTGTTGQQISYGTGTTGQQTPYGTGGTGASVQQPYGTGNTVGQQTPYNTGSIDSYSRGPTGQQVPNGQNTYSYNGGNTDAQNNLQYGQNQGKGYDDQRYTGQGIDRTGEPQNVLDPNSVVPDDDDSQAEAGVSQGVNGTTAIASSNGGSKKGRAETNVQGTYTGTGSFSAQAAISDDNKGAESQVSGSKKGATSNAVGRGKKNKSQAAVKLGSETGSIQTDSQSSGVMHSSNTQVQGSLKGGVADAQARGPGSTSSQAQIGFTPYKDGDKSHDRIKMPFEGGGTASAHSSGRMGTSQSQLKGTFKYGITYNGAAQAGASLDKDAVFSNLQPFDKIDVFNKNDTNIDIYNTENEDSSTQPFDVDLSTERTIEESFKTSEVRHSDHSHSDHHKTEPANTTNGPSLVGNRRAFPSSYGNNGDYEYNIDDNPPEEYDIDDVADGNDAGQTEQGEYSVYDNYARESDTTHESLNSPSPKGFNVRQTTGSNTQHILIGSLKNQDAKITQVKSERPDESKIYQPGERVPGTGGYVIPVGFTGSVKSVASKDKTYAVGSRGSPSQAQTVTLTPGTGKIKYTYPDRYSKSVHPKDLRSLYNSKPVDNRYVSVSKSVTRDLDSENNIRKQYSHTYYTKSSSCGYFTFTCTMVSSSEGKKKVCKPKIPTNPDGTPIRC